MDELIPKILQTIDFFKKSNTFLLTSCASPDGDSIASQLIIGKFLQQIKQDRRYQVDIINERPCPSQYSFLEGHEQILPWAQAKPLDHYDVGMVTDGGPERVGCLQPVFDKCKVKIIVDHHLVGSHEVCDIQLIDPKRSSTCELLYTFLKIPDSPIKLTPALAEMFYVGIIFDTGAFQYNLTSSFTHQVAADLLATGINFSWICEKVLLEYSATARKLQGRVLSNIKYTLNDRIAWSEVNLDLIHRWKIVPADMEGLVNMLNFIKGVEIAILFYEQGDGVWKISLRSRGHCNVAKLARTLTQEGGGHERAAGCTLKGSYEEITTKVLNLAKDFLI